MAILKPVTDQLGFLVDLGFRRKGGFLQREDRLLRAATVSQHQNAGDAVSFFVSFDLGIPGISEVSGHGARHVVRCSADNFAAELGFSGSFAFRIAGGNDELLAVVHRAARIVCERFLLKYPDRDALFEMVYRGATEFLSRGPASSDEMTQLKVHPWNVMKRLELAGVFAAFLGKQASAAEVVRLAREHATGRHSGLDYLLPSLMANVESAAALGQGRIG